MIVNKFFSNFLKKINKKFSGKYEGNFRSFLRGFGLEIEDFRNYEYGDDIKFINRKLSAKQNNFIINIFRQEKNINFHIFFDLNINWNGGILIKFKDIIFDILKNFFVFAKRYNLDLTGFFVEDGKLKVIDIKKNPYKLYFFLDKSEKLLKNFKLKYYSNLKKFLNYQKNIKKKHGIIIFSDLFDLDEYDILILKQLNLTNELFLFKINIDDFEGINFDRFFLEKKNYQLNFLKIINLP